MKTDELLRRYELDAMAKGYSTATIVHVKRCVGYFTDFLGRGKDVTEVSADDFRRYLAGLRDKRAYAGLISQKERKIGSTSINTYARAIKSFWGWLEGEGILKENPLALVPTPKKARTIPKIYSIDEIKTVLRAVSDSPRSEAMVLLLLDSGIRLSELTSLKVSDIDVANGRIKVFGKGGKQRFAYFSKDTGDSINLYLRDIRPKPTGGDYLFLRRDGYPLRSQHIQKILQRIGKQAGISQRLSPHKLRHTYATLALKYGSNLEYIKTTLGHSDIKTTSQSYINIADSDIAAAYQGFSPVANIMSPEKTKQPVSKDETVVAQGILESKGSLTLKPLPGEPSTIPAEVCAYTTLDIEADDISIISVQVFTNDPQIKYRLMLFAIKPPDDPNDWYDEDLLRMDMVAGRIFTYSPDSPLVYRDCNNSRKLHFAICIGQRPRRFNLEDDEQKADYYQAPVSYTTTLKYRLVLTTI